MEDRKRGYIEKAGRQARENILTYRSCSQAVVGAFRQLLGDAAVPEAVLKAATGFSGGGSGTGNLCGALSGGIMVISLFAGRDAASWGDTVKKEYNAELGRRLIGYFEELYGSVNCTPLKEHIVSDDPPAAMPPESLRVLEDGTREADCSEVTRQTAMKVMEILLEEGFVTLPG
ncbi:MAG: C_GCAxxG_C_C family protein [Spirochaetales bacterium]|nr:C_GCAxxG_C_C family protein [Spirochaetales bacterium]